MRTILISVFLTALAAHGGEPGVFVEQPNLVGKITEALIASKTKHLTPRSYNDGGRRFSYQLTSVSYLGIIQRGSEKFILATARFQRSSAQDGENPPARGHAFLLCLSTDFRLISHCRLAFPDVELVGTTLSRQKQKIGDFAATDEVTRRHGYRIDGDEFLPYPFADRLPDSRPPPTEKPFGERAAPTEGDKPAY